MGTSIRTFAALAALLASASIAAADTVSFTILAGKISGPNPGTAINANAMLQLVDLGSDGVFNPISEGGWVGGDDTVITAPFAPNGQNSDGWLSAGSFDLSDGAGVAGEINRIFSFLLGEDIQTGDKVGIRWFPTLTANNDYASSTPILGTPYGQFTRQAAPRHGGSLWQIPTGGALVSFDRYLTSDYTATNPDALELGSATFAVIPEPATVALTLLGLGLACSTRRRRAAGC